jgi:hypothetical protein
MMVIVAVAAIAIGGAAGLARVGRLASEYRRLYAWHSSEVQRHSEEAGKALALRNGRDRYVRASRLAHYHARLEAKYGHAAHNPWLPVEPDPSPPD